MIIKSFLFLIFLHYVADFPLQGEFLATMKGKYNYLLFCHSFIWAGLVGLGLYELNIFSFWKFGFLLGGHYVIDYWKARNPDKTEALTGDLWYDQMLHTCQIIACLLL